MSRGDFGSGGGYQGNYTGFANNGGSRDGDSEYIRLSNLVSNNIQQLNRKIASIQNLVNQLGTAQDVPENFERLQTEQKDATVLVKETSSMIQKLGNLQATSPGEARQRKMQQDKLHDNFSNALNNFQKVQRTAAEKERATLQRARTKSMEFNNGYQQQNEDTKMNRAPSLQIQTEADLSLDMIREREDAIRQLESDIVNVNEIFKDLAIMVHEQGDTIDSIEANVDSAAVNVVAGNQQLEKARDYQKASRKKMCCIMVILLLVAIVLGIIIWQSTSN